MKMKNNNQAFKVAVDMSFLQLIWSAWFMSFVFIAYLVLQRFIDNEAVNEQNFLTFTYGPAKIYMLIIGILSVHAFLTFYVKNGVTRKDYFKGAALSSIIISLVLMIAAGFIGAIEKMIDPAIETISFVGPDASLLLNILVFSLNILVCYTAGWLIGAGFYRFGGIGGMLYIVLAIVVISFSDLLWEAELREPMRYLLDLSGQQEFSTVSAFLFSSLLVILTLWIIRTTTKRVRVRLK
jgi:hypothetical protein